MTAATRQSRRKVNPRPLLLLSSSPPPLRVALFPRPHVCVPPVSTFLSTRIHSVAHFTRHAAPHDSPVL